MREIFHREDGNALVLITLCFSVMMMAFGLVIDGGHLYMQKSHLEKTVNAAALSGAQEIPNSQAKVDQVVSEVLSAHGESASLLSSAVENGRQLRVGLEKDVPLFFASLFGIDTVTIQADAKAGLNPVSAATGVVPLGMDESVELVYGQTYTLKVDAGDSASGNFGVLALDGPGAKTYGETLTHGFDEEIRVGDIINTQTGNIAGATRTGINSRIDSCPSVDYEARNCPRVMMVLVYKPYTQTTNQLTSVQITGFAYFYVTDRMSSTDDSIKGIFIKRAGAGSSGTAATPDRGAYAIKLTQ